MRIRVPRCLIALGFLLALLCLISSLTTTAAARPIGPDPWGETGDPKGPPPPGGDNDGGVLARSFARPVETTATTGSSVGMVGGKDVRVWTDFRTIYRHAGIRGILAIMRLDTWWLGPR
jgi:hypothetical protein